MPRVIGDEMDREEFPSALVEDRNHPLRVSMVLGTEIFALEEQLNVRGQIRNTRSCPKHRRLPWSVKRRIPPVDPLPLVALAYGEVERPGAVR